MNMPLCESVYLYSENPNFFLSVCVEALAPLTLKSLFRFLGYVDNFLA